MAIALTDEEWNKLNEFTSVYNIHRGDYIGDLIRGKLKEYEEHKKNRIEIKKDLT
jgi:hypothetical protein